MDRSKYAYLTRPTSRQLDKTQYFQIKPIAIDCSMKTIVIILITIKYALTFLKREALLMYIYKMINAHMPHKLSIQIHFVIKSCILHTRVHTH